MGFMADGVLNDESSVCAIKAEVIQEATTNDAILFMRLLLCLQIYKGLGVGRTCLWIFIIVLVKEP